MNSTIVCQFHLEKNLKSNMLTTDHNLKKAIIDAFFYSKEGATALSHATSREEFETIKAAVGAKYSEVLKDFEYMSERVFSGVVEPRILSNFITPVNWKK